MAPQTINNIPLTDNLPMPWGKHAGKKMINVPAVYLMYIHKKGWDSGFVKNYITANFEVLSKEAAKVERYKK